MRYKGKVYRPPSEAYSLIVQVTYGCSHNGCAFCDMYDDKHFAIRPMEEVREDFEMARRVYKKVEQGAELVCFGDIDMENNRAWGEERCRNVGLDAVYPLWHHDRQENVREVLELGYRCLIKTLDRRVLPRHLLGRVMDRAMVEEMTACGVDVCGENGEFHTIAVDGPVFHRPIPYCVRQVLDLGDYSVADITVPEKE